MYCKYCGKQIADNSSFCMYFGGKQDVFNSDANAAPTQDKEPEETPSKNEAPEATNFTNDSKPLQVEISKKETNNKSTIANEIVSNLKMVGVALVCFIVFMIGFFIFHIKDIQQHPYTAWGESCYDESYVYGDEFGIIDSKEMLMQYKIYRLNEQKGLTWDGSVMPKDYPECLRNKYNLPDSTLRVKAIWDAGENYAKFSEYVNEHRKIEYKNDLKAKAKYSAIIFLALCIIGRYIFKLAKWTKENKTE